jgi:hypothetical protein
MSWFIKGLVYSFVAAAVVLRYLPYPRFKRQRNTLPPEPTHRPNPRVYSSYGSAPLRNEAQEVREMKRAVGYCTKTECEDFSKGVFLLNHGKTFYCPRCREQGYVMAEEGFASGTSEIFKEVRVEFNFDPLNDKFRETAIVRDESLWGRNNTYTLRSPLIKTEKRALKVAEAILANLNRFGIGAGGVPKTSETLISFDDSPEVFAVKCAQLQRELENSALMQQRGMRG